MASILAYVKKGVESLLEMLYINCVEVFINIRSDFSFDLPRFYPQEKRFDLK